MRLELQAINDIFVIDVNPSDKFKVVSKSKFNSDTYESEVDLEMNVGSHKENVSFLYKGDWNLDKTKFEKRISQAVINNRNAKDSEYILVDVAYL